VETVWKTQVKKKGKFIFKEQMREDVGWIEWSSGHLGTL
jgi:hypothetical protein